MPDKAPNTRSVTIVTTELEAEPPPECPGPEPHGQKDEERDHPGEDFVHRVGQRCLGPTHFCPIKDGSTPNLSFCETDDGRVLIYCHGGCDAGDVVRALGLNMNDLFPDGVGGNTRVLEATYTYTDESGLVLYLKHRFRTASGGKTFTFEHPGEDGDFVTGRDDIAVPYNLEGVQGAILRQERIFIVEGEKAVGALHREGLVATTSPHGAGGKKKRSWPEEWRRYFEGCAEIIILPDNDEAGRGFAAQAAALLEDSVEVVKLVELPGLEQKGDVFDWLADGRTIEELNRIIERTPNWDGTQPEPKADEIGSRETLTDSGNARRFARLHGDDVRYCHAWKNWFVWDDTRWVRDVGPAIERLAKQTALSIYAEAFLEKDDAHRRDLGKWARTSESKQHIRAMVDLATSEPGIPIRPLDFDRDPWLLNCKNGTIDLKKGNLQPHERNDFITKLAPADYEAGATCEEWERSLKEALEDDAEMVAFLARAVGYSATGTTGEEVLFFIWGPSGSFKSTFIEAIKANLGDYAMTAAFSTFLHRREQGGARSDIARLPGARFVPAVETGRGSRMDEGLVKNLTGGDRITTRSLYEREFEFDPAFTIWLVANDPPHVHHDDDAMWRRLIRVPFVNAIPKEKQDPSVKAFLKQPHPGVLAWIVRGGLDWQEHDLPLPEAVRKSTEEYRESMDPLDDFIQECCVVRPDCWIVFANLWQGYCSFQDEAGKSRIPRV